MFGPKQDEYFEVMHSPSSRAACKVCKEKIEKGVLRISHTIVSDVT